MDSSLTLIIAADFPPEAAAVALQACRQINQQATLEVIKSVENGLAALPPRGVEVLVLAERAREEVRKVTEAKDSNSLPRFALVQMSSLSCSDIVSVAPEEWSEGPVRRAIQASLNQHQLSRENATARGDLKTISRRLTHDLRAQVGGILTTAEACQETLLTHPSPESIQTVIDATEGMLKLIDRISFVIRASANPKLKEEMDMGMACWAAMQRLEAQISTRAESLLQPSSWPGIKGVSSWLEVVWGNLISNALEHGGTSPEIELGWTEAPQEFVFWVQDSGRGVAEARRSQLFHPFHLLHETNAPNGLGLPIVRRLVELQGGACCYERLAGKTRFSFTLPVV